MIIADVRKENGVEFFHYEKIIMLKGIKKEKVIEAIKNGKIYVDFDARTGHNHGTKFRIRESDIDFLYSEVHEIV